MIKPSKLGYADFAAKDIEAMEHYYTEVMGLSLVEEGDDGKRYLSTGLDHHNMVLIPSNESNLRCIGFQLDSDVLLQDAKKELQKQGISVELKSDARPGISELLELKDPDGFIIHLYTNMEMPAPRFKEHGIAPNKLGHLALGSMDSIKSAKFYQNILKFDYTDKIGERANFLTCNTDHHVLNISSLGKYIGSPNLYHLAFELRDASHQYRSLDILAKNNIPVVWGPTRHTAGHNIAAYHHDPDGNLVELFIDMDQLIPGLGYFNPRPWHEEFPLKPRYWADNVAWGTAYEKTLFEHALKKFQNITN
ncbi:VOC family protein [Oceanobacillus sp. Castelsardo]|uniref:VOC family protein n=1 Tax=Oceanobacillus sp. Castelsardo TaxID=1851204 RepID=UPI000839586F|nr:VOC family protein [Oceanobacillus sp. Castelsardo]